MSYENREGTLDEAAKSGTQVETQADDGADEKPQLIFGKYKDMESVEKAMKDAERKIQSISEENARFRERSELKEVLEKMTDVVASKNPNNEEAQRYSQMMEDIAEDFREDPGSGIKKMQDLTNAWIANEGLKIEGKIKKDYESKHSELLKEINELKNSLTLRDPDYLENKEVVDRLVEDGMAKSKAIEWAKRMRSGDKLVPVSLNGSRVIEAEKKNVYLTKEDRARLKAEGATDADLDRMEAEYQSRTARRH